ncbi:MAG: flavin reductase [Bdellovibrionales bacterium GWA2_49_15]|nr:MAG: flavin reductase [Bdellovibrionales bacterium GWA2_49_15]HAZ13011.1 flavin reductase [Bdellovibrionales bacterium]
MTKAKKEYPLNQVHRLLQSGPVVLVTTSQKGKANIMAMSWHTVIDSDPPKLGIVLSSDNYSFKILKSTKECVLNIPTLKLAAKAISCGKSSGKDVDKFKTFGFTALPASKVKAPLIGECYANVECKVVDMKMVAEYDLFILEVVKVWIDPVKKRPQTLHHLGGDKFMVAGKVIRV